MDVSHEFIQVPLRGFSIATYSRRLVHREKMMVYMGVSLNGGTAVPKKHPKMIIFSRKAHGCWVPAF